MHKLKIVLLILFSILCILIISGILFYYHIDTTYTVEPDKSQFEDAILNRINKPSTVTNNIEIKQELTLDNKKYFIVSFGDTEGRAELTKGLNKKYKMGWVGYGSSLFRCDIWETNKGKYIILFCKNKNEIQYAKVVLNGQEYKIDIPQNEYVIAYCKVPDSSKVGLITLDDINFYNSSNIDITEQVVFN
jgi:hypothetical protein